MKHLFVVFAFFISIILNAQTTIFPDDGQTTTSTTAKIITGLSINADPFTTYYFNGQLHIGCSGTGGMKFTNIAPSGSTIFMNYSGSTTSANTDLSFRTITTSPTTGTAQCQENSTTRRVHIDGSITTGAVGGTIDFEFQSATAGQTSTIYRDGSGIWETSTTLTPIWSESFGSGYAQWALTNRGSAHGISFGVASGNITWTCNHTANPEQMVADDRIVSDSSFSQNYLALFFHATWTTATNNNAQYEEGFWWDSINKIYYGNNAANDSAFFRIKVNNVVVWQTTIAKNLDRKVLMFLDRSNNTFSAYIYASTYWLCVAKDISTASYSIPSSSVEIFSGVGDYMTRSGGDTGSIDYFYLYNSKVFPNPN